MKGHISPAILAGAHKIDWLAIVYAPNGRVVPTQVEEGTVTLTGRDRGRCRGELSIVDTEGLWDRTGETGASPYGGEIRIQATIGSETIDVAGGFIFEVSRTRPGSTLDVAFVDYGSMLAWCDLTSPSGIPKGMALMTAVNRWAYIIEPTATIVDPGVKVTTVPAAYTEQGSHEGGLAKLCSDTDLVIWVDERRRLRVQNEQILDSTPAVYTFSDGGNGTVTSENQTLSRDDVPGAVVVTGETPKGATAPIIGSAYQSTGPTRWGGPFGYPRQRVNRPVLTSKNAANAAARTILNARRRLKRTMTLSAVTHPGLEPGDRVDAMLAGSSRIAMVLDSVTFRLSPDPMTVQLIEAVRIGVDSTSTALWTRTTEPPVPVP